MRQANTTFVNLRAALDDVDPLVDASKPVADRLRPFFREFRVAARDAVPTIRDLDAIVGRRGRANDLVELTRCSRCRSPRPGSVSGRARLRADPEPRLGPSAPTTTSPGLARRGGLRASNAARPLANLRAYTPELVGWFDGFSTSGSLDASGGLGPHRGDLQRLHGLARRPRST